MRAAPATRDRRDRCPGAFRPWCAHDGLLVRIRLIGGQVDARALRELSEAATEFGDGHVHTTSRANLQVRGLPAEGSRLDPGALTALRATGLIPTASHELVRNVLISPQTGLAGGRADLRRTGRELDRLLSADPVLADLPGRFLFVLDDGRGDLRERACDLGLVALDGATAQLRIGAEWGPVVALEDAPGLLIDLARRFMQQRGSGPSAAWHVVELGTSLIESGSPDARLPQTIDPPAFGDIPGGRLVEVPDTGLDRTAVQALTAEVEHLVVTPWRGVLVPEQRR